MLLFFMIHVDILTTCLKLFYPINDTKLGGGNTAIDFKSRSLTNFTFPINFSYNTSNDQQGVILRDLAAKCGVGGKKSNLDIDYKISVSASSSQRTLGFSMRSTYLVGYPLPYCHHIPRDIEFVQFPLSDLYCRCFRTFFSV